MNTPISVPPAPLRRERARDAAAGRRWRGRLSRAIARITSAPAPTMPSTASPFFSTWPVATTSASRARAHRGVVDQEPLGIIVTVEFLGQILEVERDLVRREVARRVGELPGKVGEPAQQRLLVRARRAPRGRASRMRSGASASRDARLPQHRAHARMRVLHVVDGVVLRLRAREVDVEHELGVGLARHEEVAHGVAPRFVDEVAQRDVARRRAC